jgi:ABC-type lipoprotein release transport system permease subunit
MRGTIIARRVPPTIDYPLVIASVLGLIALVIVSCALRGARAARLNPVDALRTE